MALSNDSAQQTKTADSGRALPDVLVRTENDIVVYDGNCNFCRGQVERLYWFSGDRLSFISLHDSRVADWFPGLSRDELMKQMYVVATDGTRFGGAAAIRYLSRKLPRLWFVAPLLHIPFSLPVWQFFYDRIARHRYLIAGGNRNCENGSCNIQD